MNDKQKLSESSARKQFPAGMFITAALFSSITVFIISAVFTQANTPCINSQALQDQVIVDTHQSRLRQSNTDQPMIICNRNNQQVTWLTWLFKRSESVDFHYLDLLELLSRDN